MRKPLVVSAGGGVNTAGMLVGMAERDIRPDLIIFSDTGDEKPETYAFNRELSEWCESKGFPSLVTVKNDGMYNSIEDECLRRHTLPPIVMGFKTCSDKWKRRPIEKYLKANGLWASGVTMAIGIDASEPHRLGDFDNASTVFKYFLVEWGWRRQECVAAIQRAGLSVPIKSACWHCPSSKPREVIWLSKNHPELFARAVAMEDNAEGLMVRGLGRHWSWKSVVAADEAQFKMFPETVETPCMCFDGSDDEA